MATDLDATLFPFGPDWREGYVQTFEYKTDIIISRSGKEQRRALRSLPRRGTEFTPLVSGSDLGAFNALLAAHQSHNLLLPDLTRSTPLTAPVAETASSFTLPAVPAWLIEGAWIILLHGSRLAGALVSDVTGTTITLADPLADAWPAGTSVCRGVTGLLDDDLRATMPVNAAASAALRFLANPGTDTDDDSGAAETTFNGREVFTLRPNWSGGLGLTYIQSPERVDFGRGVIRAFRPVDFPSQVRQSSFVGRTIDEANLIRRFFGRMKGQRGEFYMATGINDLPPITPLTSVGTTLTVAGSDVAAAYAGSTVYKALSVRLQNGNEIRRRVTGLAPSGGNSVVTVDSVWGTTVQPGDVVMASWMPVWRFASDLLTLEWLTASIAQASLSMRMLEDL